MHPLIGTPHKTSELSSFNRSNFRYCKPHTHDPSNPLNVAFSPVNGLQVGQNSDDRESVRNRADKFRAPIGQTR